MKWLKKYQIFENENVIKIRHFHIPEKPDDPLAWVGNNDYFFELLLDGEIVSEATLEIVEPGKDFYPGRYAGLFDLHTEKEYQGRGLMRKLLEHIFKWVKKKGIDAILLNVYKSNTSACKLYFSCGFEVYKEYNDSEDIEPYWTLIKKLA